MNHNTVGAPILVNGVCVDRYEAQCRNARVVNSLLEATSLCAQRVVARHDVVHVMVDPGQMPMWVQSLQGRITVSPEHAGAEVWTLRTSVLDVLVSVHMTVLPGEPVADEVLKAVAS